MPLIRQWQCEFEERMSMEHILEIEPKGLANGLGVAIEEKKMSQK